MLDRHRANEEARRARDVRGELAAAMRAWFAGPELERLHPVASQPTDTVLGERIGLPHTGELISKRSSQTMRVYGRVSQIEKQRWGSKIRCALNCREVSPLK